MQRNQSLLRRLFGQKTVRPERMTKVRRPVRVSLRLESLEDRALPSTVQFDISSVINAKLEVTRNAGVTQVASAPVDLLTANNAFVSQSAANFLAPLGDIPVGLPDNGFFAANTNHPDVQLLATNANNGNNALRQTTTTGFSVNVPANYYSQTHLYFTSGSGSDSFHVVLHYAAGPNDTSASVSLPDWFFAAPPPPGYSLISGVERSAPDGSNYDTRHSFSIWGYQFNPDPTRVLTSVTVQPDTVQGTFDFFGGVGVTTPAPIVYVDSNWAGTAPGADPATDPVGGLVFGVNAFSDIPGGINAVTTNGTVVVYGGTYNAAVNFNKALQPIQISTNALDVGQPPVVTENGAATLGVDTQFALNNTALTFGSTVDGGHNLSFTGNGVLTFDGAVGGTTALTSLTTGAGGTTDLNGGPVTTTGPQHYGDPVLLSADTTLTTASGNVQFDSTVNSIGATHSLTLNSGAGNVLASGAIGGALALSSLSVTSAQNATFSSTIRTTGDVTQTAGTGTTTINGTSGAGIGGNLNLTTANITVNGANIVGGQVTLSASGVGTINGTINAGGNTVTLTGGGTFTLFGADRLSSLGNPVSLGANTTLDLNSFNQTFGSLASAFASPLVRLTGAATLTTGAAGSTTYAGRIQGGGNLTKVGASTFTLSGPSTYSGATSINGGILLLTGSLTGAGSSVFLNANGVVLDGGGTGQIAGHGVVVNPGVTNGLIRNLAAVMNNGGTGVLLSPGSSARVLNNTISGNLIGIDVNNASAFIQGNNLNFNVAAGTDGISSAAGLRARNGAVVDAGQVGGGFDFTNLNGGGVGQGSTGTNTFVGYTPAPGVTAPPNVPQAILDLNIDNIAGPRGEPFDLMAQNDIFGDNAGHTYPPQAPPRDFTNIENLVFHDVDNSRYGFINYVTPTSSNPHLIGGPRVYNKDRNADPTFKQRSMIAHVELAFDNFVSLGPTALTINKVAPLVSIPTASNYVGPIGTTVSNVFFDVATGEFRTSMGFTGSNGLEVSGSLEDGDYKLHMDATQIQAFIAPPPSVPAFQLSGGTIDLKFWRLYGDVKGIGYIDTGAGSNQMLFNAAYGSRKGMANYHDYLDYDGSLQVGSAAFFQFRRRLQYYTAGHTVVF